MNVDINVNMGADAATKQWSMSFIFYEFDCPMQHGNSACLKITWLDRPMRRHPG